MRRRYFIDEKARKLYFMPPEGQTISTKPVTLSVNHSAVVGLAAGTKHVQFVGLTVGFGRSTGIAASSVDNVEVKNCTVRTFSRSVAAACRHCGVFALHDAGFAIISEVHADVMMAPCKGVRSWHKWD